MAMPTPLPTAIANPNGAASSLTNQITSTIIQSNPDGETSTVVQTITTDVSTNVPQSTSSPTILTSATIINGNATSSATFSGTAAQCTIAFDQTLNYDFVYTNNSAQEQIFYYIPRLVSYALNLTTLSQVIADSIVRKNSSLPLYNTTTVTFRIASSFVNSLANEISSRDSWLYKRIAANDELASIISHVDSTWPLQPGPAIVLAPEPSANSNTTDTGSSPSSTTTSDDGSRLSSQAKIGVGVGVGAIGLIILSISAFILWKKQSRKSAKSLEKYAITTEPGLAADDTGTAIDQGEGTYKAVR